MVGADRYATAALVDTAVFESPDHGRCRLRLGFTDALSGGVFESLAGGPLLLSAPTALSAATSDYPSTNKATVGASTIFGSTVALASAVQDDIAAALRW